MLTLLTAMFLVLGVGQAQASVALVQHTSIDVPLATSATLTFNSNNTAGNWIGVCIRAGRSSEVFTVTDSKGNTYHQAVQINMTVDTPNGDTLAIFYAQNIAAGANTITVSDTISATLRFSILEYSGVATTNSLDVTASAQGTSTTPNSGNATTTAAGDLLLGAVATADAATYTTPSGVEIEEHVPAEPNTKVIAEDKIQTSAGTVSASATLGTSDPWGAVLATFKATSGGGTAPNILSLNPTSGVVGTSVTVTGANFGTTQGTSTVKFNGTAGTPTSWNATTIVVPVPSGATTGNVVVTVSSVASNGVAFTVAATPNITSLSPTSGTVGTSVTVTGTNFGTTQGTSTVTFNGTAGTPTSWGATSIVVPVPSGASTGNVVVTVSSFASNGLTFTVAATPSITSLSPTSGVLGTSVTIAGTNFGSSQGTSTVTFNGVTGTPTSWGATSIVVPVPNGATTGNVVVTVSALASNGVAFTVIPPPTITNLSVTSAPVGTAVTVTGTNFTANNVTPTVTLNPGFALPAPVSNFSATSITFVIPTGAATGPVTVTANGPPVQSSQTLTITAASSFTLTATPSTATLLPGQSTTYQVSLASTNGFTQLASLAVTGLPSGVIGTFQPTQITAGQFTILTLTAPANQTPGSVQITITATAVVQGITQTASANPTLQVSGTSGVAFAGRVAVTDSFDTPLVGLTVKMLGVNQNGVQTGCTGSIPTDGSGNFVLNGLSASCAGGQLIQYDPSTVTSPPGTYSGVTLSYLLTSGQVTTPGGTLAPGFIVHLPRVDNAETFFVQQNASVDQTFTSASIPGVTITVYAGTTLSLANNGGSPTPFPLSVVEIPFDRLPELMPPNATQDPRFAMSIEPFNSFSSQPVAVSYPNRSNLPPGTAMPLNSLNPTLGMMQNYGTASVSADGTQIVPDYDTTTGHPGHRYGISHFDWHFPLPPANALNSCQDGPNCPKAGDPIDLSSGLMVVRKTDIVLGGARGQIGITRIYRGATTNPGPFGIGTNHNYGYMLDTTNYVGGLINLIMPDGNQIPFVQSGGQTYGNTTIPSVQGAVLSNLSCSFGAGCSATIRWKNGTTFQFQPITGQLTTASFLMSLTDSNGNKTTLVRNASTQITQIVDPVGRSLNLTYDNPGRGGHIISIADPIGRTVQYTYTAQGYLQTVADANTPAGVTTYGYDSNGNLQTIKDARLITYLTNNAFDSFGRVLQQTAIDGGVTNFNYTVLNPIISASCGPGGCGVIYGSPIVQTTVTDPLGNQTTYHFNPAGFLLDVTDALGRKTVLTRQSGTNLLLSVTDPLNRTTAFTYDSSGNATSVTRLAGSSNAVTTSMTYDPIFNKLTRITDPLGHATSFEYDKAGNLTQVTDAINPSATFTYDSAGEFIAATDPLGNTGAVVYDGFGNLVQFKDPIGRTVSRVADAVGRTQSITNPSAQTVQLQYNPLGEIKQITDPLNGQTTTTYDSNGNLLTLTDALSSGHTTTYAYDNMDRVSTRQDPLQHPLESYQYDKNGNLTQFTDRRGKVTTFQYDAVNRRTFVGFGAQAGPTYESSITYTYDGGDRLVQAKDTTSGTITRSYDGLDRLLSEVTPQGSVNYAYDAAGRRTNMGVSGQAAVTYAFDNANRLTQITQGSANVSFGYDNDNRRTSLTLPNGVALNYGYDAASQLTGITYKLGTNTLGNLTYSYDLAGRRTGVGGTYARANAPVAAPSASYNVNNQLTNWKGATLQYDANGNLTSDGTNTYTWNARNQLVSISGGVSASLQYDPFGRRVSKTIGGMTQYLYDGANPVQEISGTTASANLLTGGVDEYFQRTDSAGARNFLTDALGSTLALTDSTGTVQTSYTFEPFGNTAVSGTITSNSFAYTGRELDATGLHFYRARYYSPSLQRFISEDPIGFDGGLNLYGYADDNPVDGADPTGLCSDPGGSGMRICIDAFISDPRAELLFSGDNRGPNPYNGSFRLEQLINSQGSRCLPGKSRLLGIPVKASLGTCSLQRFNFSGRKQVIATASAGDGWFFGLAPEASFNFAIDKTNDGYTVRGMATVYPSFEIWAYSDDGPPVLIFSQTSDFHQFTGPIVLTRGEVPVRTQNTPLH